MAPRACSSLVKLSDCIPSEKPETKARPEKRLPPCFGTMFICRPAVSVSPRPPDVSIVTSCALPMSAVKFGGWLPPGGLLMFSPSTRETRLDAAAAVDREDREHRAGGDVAGVGHESGNHAKQVAVAAHTRHVAQRLVIKRYLARRALDVDDGCLSGHVDCLLHTADAHVGVHGDDSRAADDHTVAFHGGEPGQRERHAVRARPQIFDSISSRAVGDRRADFLDQLGAGGLDRRTRQHGAG